MGVKLEGVLLREKTGGEVSVKRGDLGKVGHSVREVQDFEF